MRLSREIFGAKYQTQDLRLAFIGMSNIGKSYTAARLARTDEFNCVEVDSHIQNRLSQTSIRSAAQWMGHPFEAGYSQKSRQYLDIEAELTQELCQRAGNIIIDTTGSVVHLPDNVIKSLKNNALCIYIKANNADISALIQRYMQHPKPTIWGESFKPVSGMSDLESMMACYPQLLAKRAALYENLADITLAAADLTQPGLKDEDILPMIRAGLNKEF